MHFRYPRSKAYGRGSSPALPRGMGDGLQMRDSYVASLPSPVLTGEDVRISSFFQISAAPHSSGLLITVKRACFRPILIRYCVNCDLQNGGPQPYRAGEHLSRTT